MFDLDLFFYILIDLVSYNYRKKEYENKVLNRLNIKFYLWLGGMQVIVIILFLLLIILYYGYHIDIIYKSLTPMGIIGMMCLIFLYIKQLGLYSAIQKPLFTVVDKSTFKKAKIIYLCFALIPIVGFFSTGIFYNKVVKVLKANDFTIKSIGGGNIDK